MGGLVGVTFALFSFLFFFGLGEVREMRERKGALDYHLNLRRLRFLDK